MPRITDPGYVHGASPWQSVQRPQETTHQPEDRILYNRGMECYHKGEYQLAKQCFQQALDIANNIGVPKGEKTLYRTAWLRVSAMLHRDSAEEFTGKNRTLYSQVEKLRRESANLYQRYSDLLQNLPTNNREQARRQVREVLSLLRECAQNYAQCRNIMNRLPDCKEHYGIELMALRIDYEIGHLREAYQL